MSIPIIDLFAGPGGLGEGFSSVLDKKGKRVFDIALSIEKDEFAHQTLTLRSFLRQFPPGEFPVEYYQFVRGELKSEEELYKLYPEQSEHAKKEAWQFTLGSEGGNEKIDQRIRESLNGQKDFVLIGGPPCQAYSLVGRARRQEKDGLKKEDERVFLYREYYRILAEHQPPVFVMENVKGLLSSKLKEESIFKQIVADLQRPIEAYKKLRGAKNIDNGNISYRIYSLVKPIGALDIENNPVFDPKDFVIRAEEYGIPQTRHRVILLGIRNDYEVVPEVLKRKNENVSVDKVLAGLPRLRSGLSKTKDGGEQWKKALFEMVDSDLTKIEDKELTKKIKEIIKDIKLPIKDRGALFVPYDATTDYLPEWYLDKKLGGVPNSETRSHIAKDLHRYLFAACFAKINKRSPKLSDFPKYLLPKHDNVTLGIKENKFADRFRVQLSGLPSKTVTSHISKDGHYFIHPDPSQCRSFTVREAARVQTFPDNYYFCGPRTEQYHQVGNAVPPYLAYQIATVVSSIMLH